MSELDPATDDETRATTLLGRAPVAPPAPGLHDAMARLARRLADAAGEGVAPGAALGPYTVRAVLGRGGQATVYLATDREGRAYAVKSPRRQLVAALVREAQILFHLDHPRVVRIESAVIEADVAFIATEYLPAGSLADRLRGGARLPLGDALSIAAAILEALVYAHDKGVVHRDLKPSNVLFDGDGQPKVADFGVGSLGLLRDHGVAQTLGSLTLAGGTPLYMAPEQEAGETVDGRADLYALGKLLYECVSGCAPRTIKPLSRAVAGLDPAVDAFVFRLVEDRPEDRFPTAQAALDAARALLRATSPAGPPDDPRPIALLRLSPAVQGALEAAGLRTIGALCRRSSGELDRLHGLDRAARTEVRARLAGFGRRLRPGEVRARLDAAHDQLNRFDVAALDLARRTQADAKAALELERGQPVLALGLSAGALALLEAAGIHTLDALCTRQGQVQRLLRGREALEELEERLAERGLHLGYEEHPTSVDADSICLVPHGLMPQDRLLHEVRRAGLEAQREALARELVERGEDDDPPQEGVERGPRPARDERRPARVRLGDRVGEDDDARHALLQTFRGEARERVARASRALAARALDEVERELLTIAGSARLLGFQALGALAGELAALARSGHDDHERGALLAQGCARLAALVDESATMDRDRDDIVLHARVGKITRAADEPLAALWLPRRALRRLEAAGIRDVRALCALRRVDLLAMRDVGRAVVEQIDAWLAERGLHLRPEGDAAEPRPAREVEAAAAPDVSEQVRAEQELLELATRDLKGLFEQEIERSPTIELDQPLEALALSLRATSCLHAAGVRTVGALCALRLEELARIWSVGRVTLKEIEARLAERGLRLRPAEDAAGEEARLSWPELEARLRRTQHDLARLIADGEHAALMQQRALPLDALALSRPTHERLASAGLRTTGELALLGEDDLLRRAGQAARDEVEAALAARGLRSGMQLDPAGPFARGPSPAQRRGLEQRIAGLAAERAALERALRGPGPAEPGRIRALEARRARLLQELAGQARADEPQGTIFEQALDSFFTSLGGGSARAVDDAAPLEEPARSDDPDGLDAADSLAWLDPFAASRPPVTTRGDELAWLDEDDPATGGRAQELRAELVRVEDELRVLRVAPPPRPSIDAPRAWLEARLWEQRGRWGSRALLLVRLDGACVAQAGDLAGEARVETLAALVAASFAASAEWAKAAGEPVAWSAQAGLGERAWSSIQRVGPDHLLVTLHGSARSPGASALLADAPAFAAELARLAAAPRPAPRARRLPVGRVALEVAPDGRSVAAVELRCETELGASRDAFEELRAVLPRAVLDNDLVDAEAARARPSIDGALALARAALREEVELARVEVRRADRCGAYVHNDGRLGAAVGVRCSAHVASQARLDALLRDLCMQVVAHEPSPDPTPERLLARESLRDPSRTVRQVLDGAARELGPLELVWCLRFAS